MVERTNIPSSPECGQWETLLPDALDGLLGPQDQATFTAHLAVCSACAALYEESRRGREWLEFLAPEPEVPEGLLDRILAQTGPGQAPGHGMVAASSNVISILPPWQRPGFMGQVRRFAEPRLLMTAAMAFFSIALTLNLTNVRLSSLRLNDLRPTAVRSFVERRVTMASTPIIRYYDHLRFVYEVESRMRELRRANEAGGLDGNTQQAPKQGAPGESKQTPGHKDGGSRVEPPQQSVSPGFYEVNDSIESTLASHPLACPYSASRDRSAHSGGSAMEVRERSTTWTA